jgi:hypothetical protein
MGSGLYRHSWTSLPAPFISAQRLPERTVFLLYEYAEAFQKADPRPRSPTEWIKMIRSFRRYLRIDKGQDQATEEKLQFFVQKIKYQQIQNVALWNISYHHTVFHSTVWVGKLMGTWSPSWPVSQVLIYLIIFVLAAILHLLTFNG